MIVNTDGNLAALEAHMAEQDAISISDDRDNDLKAVALDEIARFKADKAKCLIELAEDTVKRINDGTTAIEYLANWLDASLSYDAADELNDHCLNWVRLSMKDEFDSESIDDAIKLVVDDVMAGNV